MEYETVLKNTPPSLLNKVTPIKVWAYDAKNLYPIKGSPYTSKTQPSKYLGISRNVISYFIDSWKAEGIKGRYLFSRPLLELEIDKLRGLSEKVKLGNKKIYWIPQQDILK